MQHERFSPFWGVHFVTAAGRVAEAQPSASAQVCCPNLAFLRCAPGPGQAKVADLEVARGVEQQVARLEVAVQHVCGVHVLEAPQHLRADMRGDQGEQCHNPTGQAGAAGVLTARRDTNCSSAVRQLLAFLSLPACLPWPPPTW